MTNEDSWKKASKASKKRVVRTGGGQIWEDETLKDWDPNDYRVFCGDLGNDVTDEVNPNEENHFVLWAREMAFASVTMHQDPIRICTCRALFFSVLLGATIE